MTDKEHETETPPAARTDAYKRFQEGLDRVYRWLERQHDLAVSTGARPPEQKDNDE